MKLPDIAGFRILARIGISLPEQCLAKKRPHQTLPFFAGYFRKERRWLPRLTTRAHFAGTCRKENSADLRFSFLFSTLLLICRSVWAKSLPGSAGIVLPHTLGHLHGGSGEMNGGAV